MTKLFRVVPALLLCAVYLCTLTAAAAAAAAGDNGDAGSKLAEIQLERSDGEDDEFLEIDIEKVRESIRKDSLSESGNHRSSEEEIAVAAAESDGSIVHGVKKDGSDAMDIPVMDKEYFSDQRLDASAASGASISSSDGSKALSKSLDLLGVAQARSLFNRLRSSPSSSFSSSDGGKGLRKHQDLAKSRTAATRDQTMNEHDSTEHHTLDSSVSAHSGKEEEDDDEDEEDEDSSSDKEFCDTEVAAASSTNQAVADDSGMNSANQPDSLLQQQTTAAGAVEVISGGSTPTSGWEYLGDLEEEEVNTGKIPKQEIAVESPTSKGFVSVTSPPTIMSNVLSVGSGLGEEDAAAAAAGGDDGGAGQVMLKENVQRGNDQASTSSDPTFFIESTHDQEVASPRHEANDVPPMMENEADSRMSQPLTTRKRQLTVSDSHISGRSGMQSPLRFAKRPYTPDQPKRLLHAATSTERTVQSTTSLLSVAQKQENKQPSGLLLDEDGHTVVTPTGNAAMASERHVSGSAGSSSAKMEGDGESKHDDLPRPFQFPIVSSMLHHRVRAPWSWRVASHQSSSPGASMMEHSMARANRDSLVERVNQAAAAASSSSAFMQPDQSPMSNLNPASTEWIPASTGLRRVRSTASTEDPKPLANVLTNRFGFMSRSDPSSDATPTASAHESKWKMAFGTEPWIMKQKADSEQYDVENPMVPVGCLQSDRPDVIIDIQPGDEDGSHGDLRQNPSPICVGGDDDEEEHFCCCTCFTYSLKSMSSFLSRKWKQSFFRPKERHSSSDDPEALYRNGDLELTTFCDLPPPESDV